MTPSTARAELRPDFLVIGAEKAGTTTLHELLDKHPDISMSDPKEPSFFCQEAIYDRGWDWYRQFFSTATGRVLGEASPAYTIDVDFPGTADRIARDLPEAKLLYIVRDPIARIESAWMWYRAHGRHKLGQRVFPPLERAVHEVAGLVEGSRYWHQLSLYRDHFPDDQIHVLFLEDLRRDPEGTLQAGFEFVGVDPAVAIEDPAHVANESAGQRMDTDFVTRLRTIPALEALRHRSPAVLRRTAARMLKQKITGRPTWEPGTLARVETELRADAAALLDYAGKPADFWSLGARASVG